MLTAARYEAGPAFVKEVINTQVFNRLDSASPKPFYYYFAHAPFSFATSFPLALIVLGAFANKISDPRLQEWRLLRHCAIWMLAILVGLSIPGDKKVRYLLPLVPAASMIAAHLFVIGDRNRFLLGVRKLVVKFCYLLPVLGMLFLLAESVLPSQIRSLMGGVHQTTAIVLLGLELVLMFVMQKKLAGDALKMLTIFALGVASFATFHILVIVILSSFCRRIICPVSAGGQNPAQLMTTSELSG